MSYENARPLIASAQAERKQFYNNKNASFLYKKLKHALRCNIARHLTGESYRLFSIRLADSTLLQWFTGISAFGSCKAISKSALDRYEKYFDENLIANGIRRCLSKLSDETKADTIGLTHKVDFSKTFMDSTCVKSLIHFPVDWVLLKDAVRSLLRAIQTIRAQGLKHRITEPSLLLKEINNLCINMTHTRRKKNSKKNRKSILRAMKKLASRLSKHGKRYRQLLMESWQQTKWSEAQAEQVIGRIENILEQLPKAIKQAHERIIGERQVSSREKLLSLYDKDVEVIVRGKAGNEVEFGQRLLLTEQADDLIMDWELFSKDAPSDNQLLKPTINRIEEYFGVLNSVSTDRAFASAENDEFLKEKNIYNAVCPKSPKLLEEKLKDPIFLSFFWKIWGNGTGSI